MNTLLLVIALFASAVAVASIIAVFVAYRDARRRSDARVAALQELAGVDAADEIALMQSDRGPHDLGSDDVDLNVEPAAGPEPARPMFGGRDAESPWGRRLAAAAAMAVLVAAGGYLLIPRSSGGASGSTAVTQASQAPSLELLSLRHTQEEGRLVITGLVQNPRTGAPLTRIVATAFLFGSDGTFLASGRAPLDFSTLGAGDESPFVVAVPVTGTVARYRVGFRGEDGRVIGHVDRRTAGTLAHTGPRPGE